MVTWLNIPEYKGYQINNLGEVRTFNKITSNKLYSKRCWKNRILKQKISTNKYGRKDKRIDLWKEDGTHKTYLISRLVACTFFKEPLDTKLTVNHIDGDSLNNNINNLELVTRKENIQHEFRTNLYKGQIKIKITDKVTGTIIFPSSLNEGNKYINKNHSYLSSKIKQNIFENDNYKWELI